jgi:hypothetical protein
MEGGTEVQALPPGDTAIRRAESQIAAASVPSRTSDTSSGSTPRMRVAQSIGRRAGQPAFHPGTRLRFDRSKARNAESATG